MLGTRPGEVGSGEGWSEQNFVDVLACYDLGTFRAARRIERGYVNQLWVIETTRGRFVLKRRHPSLRETRAIVGQHALVRHLSAVGFPAPSFVVATSGASFVELGHEVYEIQEYIPGRLSAAVSPSHIAAAAQTLGCYHCSVLGFDHPALHRERERYGIGALKRILGSLVRDWEGKQSPEVEHMSSALAWHAGDLESVYSNSGALPELVIHGDYYAENLIWQGNTVVGVVDYDQAHWCTRVLELAEALIYFARERGTRFRHIVYSGVLDLEAAERFLWAYTERVSLSEAEIRALPHMVRLIWMCASLDPPLRPAIGLEEATQALPEVLALADWAALHAPDITQIGLDIRSRQMTRQADSQAPRLRKGS